MSDEELEEEYKKLAEQYNMELDKIKESMGESGSKALKEDIKIRKAVDLVVESAVEK